MTTRLGLDIGTNSIGWCLYDGDSIRAIGSRIFSDGRDPKSGASLAVDRRDARAMRVIAFQKSRSSFNQAVPPPGATLTDINAAMDICCDGLAMADRVLARACDFG